MSARQHPQHRDVGFVLEIDPDLGAHVPEAERDRVRTAARGRLISLRPGQWQLGALLTDSTQLVGFLLSEGRVCSETTLRDRSLIEFFGPGDILPASDEDDLGGLVDPPAITVLQDTVLVALGATFVRAAARWPGLLTAVVHRLERQRRRLAVQALIVHLPQAKHRLLLVLWHLSLSWGHVTPDGVHVPLRLTHDILGQLTAARRPTVSLAVKELHAEGCLQRREDGTWLLTPRGQDAVRALCEADGFPEELRRAPDPVVTLGNQPVQDGPAVGMDCDDRARMDGDDRARMPPRAHDGHAGP